MNQPYACSIRTSLHWESVNATFRERVVDERHHRPLAQQLVREALDVGVVNDPSTGQ
ncbi:hypothetical protein [Saccharopolyspora aridisoli]|uniref:hypothetical protein n=1 Tax=Saccharopolyspora aridisoli TaxID=2530385 RepID=UPI001A9E0D5A|nr:hypothetical protein [Saccharopolyspora aridisoli]